MIPAAASTVLAQHDSVIRDRYYYYYYESLQTLPGSGLLPSFVLRCCLSCRTPALCLFLSFCPQALHHFSSRSLSSYLAAMGQTPGPCTQLFPTQRSRAATKLSSS